MDSSLWNGLKSSQASSRSGVGSRPEVALSLQSSLAQPTINNVNLEIWALLDRQQRIAAASGLTAGFLPQSAILTPSYGANASFGGQYAATNSLYQYNSLPVGQPVLTTSYETSNLLTNQSQGLSKNVSLSSAVNLYKTTSLAHHLPASNIVTASTAATSLKVDAASHVKKPVSYSFASSQASRIVSNSENTVGLGVRLDGVRSNSTQVPSMSSSLNHIGFASSDLTCGHVLDSGTNQSSVPTVANGSQTVLRPVDSSRLVLAPSDISLEQLSANFCLDLSNFSKPDSKTYEQNFPAQDFTMLNTEGLFSFGHPCELMSAVNMTSNKDNVIPNTSHSQQAKQHQMMSRGSPLPWSTATQFCGQQDTISMNRGIDIGATSVPTASYEAVSPPPSTETQSFSFVDNLHLYPDGVQIKDMLSSAYDMAENQIYVKNVFDMPLIYASQASGNDGHSIASASLMPLSVQAVAPSRDGSSLDRTRQPDVFANKPMTSNRENNAERGRREKNKLSTEVGVVLPMPQNKSSKALSSNPLIADFENPSSLDNHLQQHCIYEPVHYGGDAALQLHNYKPESQQKTSDVGGQGKQSSLVAGIGSRNELPSDAHNSPIVLTNITGNVYVNQYTMLQPGNMPLISQDMSYQPVAQYDTTAKCEQEKSQTKSCSILLVPSEHDDEFGHLSVDPIIAKESTCRLPDGASGISHCGLPVPTMQVSAANLNLLPKTKAVNSAFENSYVNFVQGHKSETLSSVTNSPIKNKPVLPKYVPEVRRPRPDIEKINAETVVSAGNRRTNVSSSNAANNDSTPKASHVETVVSCSDHTVANSVTIASSFVSASATKFPAKFSHKLLCKSQFLNDVAKTSVTGVTEKEKPELATDFKWKKILSVDSIERSKSNVVSPIQTPSLPPLDQGIKRKPSAFKEPSDSNATKALQVQWTVSKKSKLKKNESADIPILVIKAVSANTKAEKHLPASSIKTTQSKNLNSAGIKKDAV